MPAEREDVSDICGLQAHNTRSSLSEFGGLRPSMAKESIDRPLLTGSQESELLRIGVIGAGKISQYCHLPFYASSPHCTIEAIADSRLGLSKAVAARFGVPQVFADHRRMLEQVDLDAVVVIAPRAATGPLVLDAFEAGKHVLSEKPMAHTTEQARILVSAAITRNLVYAVGFMKRHDLGVTAGRSLIAHKLSDGELGRLVLARSYDFCTEYAAVMDGYLSSNESRAERLTEWPTAPDWLPEDRHEDYHWFVNVVSHDINLLRFVLGSEFEHVSTCFQAGGAHVAYLIGDGVNVMLEAGRSAMGRWHQGIEVIFEHGMVHIELPSPALVNAAATARVWRRDGTLQVLEPAAEGWAFRRQAEAFIEDVRGRREPLAGGADSARDLELIEALWRKELGQG